MWYIEPLPPGASRADREWHRREVEATEREIKYIWSNACSVAELAQKLSRPYPYLMAPVIEQITLDSAPARFTVKMRYGQLLGDFVDRKDRLAAAYRVPTVEFERLSQMDPQWISISLVEPIFEQPTDEPAPVPSPPAEPTAAAQRRGELARAGGPGSLSRRPHRATRRAGEPPRLPEGDGATTLSDDGRPTTAPNVFHRMLSRVMMSATALMLLVLGAITSRPIPPQLQPGEDPEPKTRA